MYLIIAGKPNGEAFYFGPFQTEDRAKEYGKALEDYRWHIVPLIVPNCIGVSFATKY